MWLRCKSVVLGRFSWITLEKDNVFYIILALDVFVSSLVKCVVDMDLRVANRSSLDGVVAKRYPAHGNRWITYR